MKKLDLCHGLGTGAATLFSKRRTPRESTWEREGGVTLCGSSPTPASILPSSTVFNWNKEQKKSKSAKEREATLEVMGANQKIVARSKLMGIWPKPWSGPNLTTRGRDFSEPMEEVTFSVADIDVESLR